MTHAFICDAVRTPIGRYGGALSSIRADDLAAIPIKALIDRNPNVDWRELDDVILGCANQAGEDNRNLARMAGLLAGLPDSSGGVTLNRLCGSGLDAVAMAARSCGRPAPVRAEILTGSSPPPMVSIACGRSDLLIAITRVRFAYTFIVSPRRKRSGTRVAT